MEQASLSLRVYDSADAVVFEVLVEQGCHLESFASPSGRVPALTPKVLEQGSALCSRELVTIPEAGPGMLLDLSTGWTPNQGTLSDYVTRTTHPDLDITSSLVTWGGGQTSNPSYCGNGTCWIIRPKQVQESMLHQCLTFSELREREQLTEKGKLRPGSWIG